MSYKAFWENPYQTELRTTVLKIDDASVQLAETIFYAESGGQESDYGTIDGINVVKAEKNGLNIIYTLEDNPHFKAGDEVVFVSTGIVDIN